MALLPTTRLGTVPLLFKGIQETSIPPELAPFQDFWNGRVVLTTQTGQAVEGRIAPVLPRDAEEVDGWFAQENQNPNKPAYKDTTWQRWWKENILNPKPNLRVVKLTVNGKIAGVRAYETGIINRRNGKPVILLGGIRIAPEHYDVFKTGQSLKGLGTALVAWAVRESIQHDVEGIVVNPSPGIENFYRKIFGAPIPNYSFDGKRLCFELTGTQRIPFLKKLYQRYQQLAR